MKLYIEVYVNETIYSPSRITMRPQRKQQKSQKDLIIAGQPRKQMFYLPQPQILN